MGPDPVIISLACQITRLKQWGAAWEKTALAKQEEVGVLKEKIRIIDSEHAKLAARFDAMNAHRNQVRAELEDLRKTHEALRLKLEASEAESRGYFEEIRKARRNACLPGEGLNYAILRMDRELDEARIERDALRAQLGSLTATHDTLEGKQVAQNAAKSRKPIAIKGLVFKGKELAARLERHGADSCVCLHESDINGESFIYLTLDGAREMAAALIQLTGGAA